MDDVFASDSAVLADYLHREANDPGFLRRRRLSAGQSVVEQAVERGRSSKSLWFHPPPILRLSKVSIGFWTLVVVFALFGLVFVGELAAMQPQQNDGGTGADGLQQLAAMMQQMMQAQQQQQIQIAELGQAVQGAGAAVGATQTITETVVNDIVQQVQGAFAQQQQAQQDQVQQLITAQQTQQQNLDQIGQVIQGLQTQQQQNVDQIGQAVQGLHQQLNQAQQTAQQTGGSGGQTSGPAGVTATSAANVGGGPIPQIFNLGGGGVPPTVGSPTVSPAVAYAMQQGAIPVDAKGLGKPMTFDPSKPDKTPNFQDWSDSIITTIDAQMPGLYEVLEWMVQTQPKTPMMKDDVKVKFPHLDPLLIEYSEHNLFAVLTTYTGGEARNLVRQAKRPNGYEAWRLLQIRFNPVTVGRQRAHLSKITSPIENVPLEKLGSEIIAWENKISDYESQPGGEKISDSLKMASLVAMCPQRLKDHLQLNAQRFKVYLDMREEVFSFLDHAVSSNPTGMDIGSLQKGGGCWVCGGPHYSRDCPKKGKGKGKDGKGKGKSKGKDAWKGKGKGKSKDGGKGKGKGKFCTHCNKPGHTRENCWKLNDVGKGVGSNPKPLNSLDPRYREIQSEFAKAAAMEYQRQVSGSPTSGPSHALPSQPATLVSSPPTSTAPALNALQSLQRNIVLKNLSALSIARGSRDSGGDASRDGSGSHEASPSLTQLLLRCAERSEMIWANIDSGAAASVCPREYARGHTMEPGDPNVFFVAANGEVVPEEGKVQLVVLTEEGRIRQVRFSVANVNKFLISAASMCDQGHSIVLKRAGERSYVIDEEDGLETVLHRFDGVYYMKLYVVPMAVFNEMNAVEVQAAFQRQAELRNKSSNRSTKRRL